MTNIIQKARDFAAMAHQGQKIIGTDTPYIAHCAQTAGLVQSRLYAYGERGHEMIAVAWLHDVLEDTDSTYADIEYITNKRVADGVLSLTDQYTITNRGVPTTTDNRAKRKEAEAFRIGKLAWDVKLVKLADIISNLTFFDSLKPSFKKVYIREKGIFVRELETFVKEPLWYLAKDLINNAVESLETVEPYNV